MATTKTSEDSIEYPQKNPLERYGKIIKLFEHQVDNFHHTINNFGAGIRFKIDCSPTGSGKTYTTLAVAQAIGLKVLAVVPKTLQTKWISVAEEYDIPIEVMTYETLRGQRDSLLKHGLFYRKDEKYIPTERLDKYLMEPTLVIFDEAQKLKNNTLTNKSATALAYQVRQYPNCYTIYVSATLFDKEEMGANILSVLGMDEEGSIITYNKEVPKRSEIAPNLLTWLTSENPLYMRRISKRIRGAKKAELQSILYQCFLSIVKPKFAYAMSEFTTEYNVDFYNGYFQFDFEHERKLKKIYEELMDSFGQSRALGERLDMGKFGESLIEIELIKSYVIARLTEYMMMNTNYSVIIGLHYIQSITYLAERLAEYDPAILTGNAKLTKQSARYKIIDKFQDGNTRIIICTTQVGGIGIDLHDTKGDRPRVVLASADYRAIDLTQVLGRTRRVGMKSPAIGLLVYCNALDEIKIWEALISKGKVLKDTSTFNTSNAKQKIRYFNEFERFDERKGEHIPEMNKSKCDATDNTPIPISEYIQY